MLNLPGYRIGETLYHSSVTTVHRAWHEARGAVVLKTTASDLPRPSTVARLRHEFRLGSSLELPGVVRYHQAIDTPSSVVLVLEDFGGTSLGQLITGRRLPVDQVLDIAIGLGQALGQLHGQQLVHRDISPGNVFYNPQTGAVKLGDLGLTSPVPRSRQAAVPPERLEGTIAYISPEQTGRMNRSIDYRTDLYSLGAVLYHLLTGRVPFEGRDLMSVVHGHIAKAPVPPHELRPELPRAISRVVLELMAKTAEDRYQSADALVADLIRIRDARDGAELEGFVPASHAIEPVFALSERLYGREQQLEALLRAFDRAADGGCELLLVTGPAGIGKTVLVNEVHKPIVARRGRFAAGKFGLYGRGRPLSALLDALSELIRDLLATDEGELAGWRKRIRAALGDEAGALLDVLPMLEHLLGQLPAVEALAPAPARERFDRLMGQLIRAFVSDDRPLVLFLDDLQWVDPASLRLLGELVADPDTRRLLLIGAFRDDEVDAAHPLSVALGELGDHRVRRISLGPLAEDDVAAMVADSTDRQLWDAAPLAALLHQKTGGNPFFVAQFLLGLVEEDLVSLSADRRDWVWDMDEIRLRDVAANVVEFMVAKLGRYSGPCLSLLQLAGCIGNRFELDTLAAVSGVPVRDVAARLWAPVRDGLVLPLGAAHDLYRGDGDDHGEQPLICKFAHDRIQEAALRSIPDERLGALHLEIARVTYARIPEGERLERIFDYVGHFNQGVALLPQEERRWLAELNLAAGRRARDATAYAAAVLHFDQAAALLEDDWERCYDLLADLHLQRVDCSYLAGDVEGAQAAFDALSPWMRTVPHIAALSQVMMRILQTENRVDDGVAEGLRCLALLGAAPPADPEAVQARMGELGAGIVALLGEKGPRALVDGPRVEDPEIVAVCGVLQETWICALMASNMPMVAFTTLSVVHISLEHGLSEVSPAGYVAQAALCALQGDFAGARLFGEAGLELVDAFGGTRLRPMVLNTYGNFTGHMVAPLKHNVQRYEESYRTCLQTGDRWWGAWAAHWARVHRFLEGDVLDEVHGRAMAYHAYIQDSGYLPLVLLSQLDLAIFANLMGATVSRASLDHAGFDQARMEQTLQQANFGYGLYVLYTFQAWLAYLYDDRERATGLLDQAEPHKDLIPGGPAYASYFFYGGLILAAALEDDATDERRTRLDDCITRIATWTEQGCRSNFEHMHRLLLGERARIDGEPRVLEHYEAAIESARQAGYIHHAAMACELAARHLAACGHPRAGRGYLQEALQLYRSWGANAKVMQLCERHPHLLAQPVFDGTQSRTVTTHSIDSAGLDIGTVLKASAAISREIDLNRLLEKLLAIVLENAGAQRGALLLDDGGLRLRAAGDTSEVLVGQDAALEDCEDLPRSVLRYVVRTRETVIEPDASRHGRFQGDPWVRSAGVRSLLCLPLLHQRKLIGVLYAENNLAPEAFTPRRVELLRLLSSQAAISLELAALYGELREALDRQTRITRSFERFVPKQFLEHLGRRSILDVELGDQVQREMTVLFMDARDFTSVSESLSAKETFALVNRLLARVGPIVRRHGGFIDKYIGDAIMALFPGAVDGACAAALEIQRAVAALRAEATRPAQAKLQVGVGIHCGVMMLGTIGETERMDSTVISDAVNIASRLEGLTKETGVGIIVSQEVLDRLEDPSRYTPRALGSSAVKGRTEPIGILALEPSGSEG
jgi:predicted ATPase/class 3 adenylate cyclase/tRNA A-37 threonylcarbamoyl transferase component Bud32